VLQISEGSDEGRNNGMFSAKIAFSPAECERISEAVWATSDPAAGIYASCTSHH